MDAELLIDLIEEERKKSVPKAWSEDYASEYDHALCKCWHG